MTCAIDTVFLISSSCAQQTLVHKTFPCVNEIDSLSRVQVKIVDEIDHIGQSFITDQKDKSDLFRKGTLL